MQECELVSTPIAIGLSLFVEQCPKTHVDVEDMSQDPYVNAVGSLLYAMVCTRLDNAHAMGVLSRYM